MCSHEQNPTQQKCSRSIFLFLLLSFYCKSHSRRSVCTAPGPRNFSQGFFLVRKRVEFLLLFAFIWLFFLIARSTSLDRLHRYLSIKSLGTNKRIFLFYFTVFARVYLQKLNQPRDWICAHFRWRQKTLQSDFFVRLNGPFPFNCSVSLLSFNGVAFDLIRSSGGNRMNVLAMLTTASTLKIVLLLN